MNQQHAYHILETALQCGVEEFCFCPGARNAPLVSALIVAAEVHASKIRAYTWFEERSAAFFAIGKSRASQKPVAVITTSGTAAGELLPAAMEAHYSGVPLLLITADRPRRFRHTGAPQCAEQVGLFGCYTEFSEDLVAGECSQLHLWERTRPAHLNVCFDEPLRITPDTPLRLLTAAPLRSPPCDHRPKENVLKEFLKQAKNLLVVVGSLAPDDRAAVLKFLLELNAPVYLESLSGLREEKLLFPHKITQPNQLFACATQAGYPIDSVLRIGGMPTFRPWRDLDERTDIQVCSLSPQPFSGLCEGLLIHTPLKPFLDNITPPQPRSLLFAKEWCLRDAHAQQLLQLKLKAEPLAEAGLIHRLSKIIPRGSLIYLGNSLPIREWDLAASTEERGHTFYASRGVNGIDGQLSTFLGLCQPNRENWALLGDLTTLYDMAGPWILRQLSEMSITVVVINNSGGQIFAPIFPEKAFLHEHQLNFKPLADMWGMHYQHWTEIPACSVEPGPPKHSLVELTPNAAATARFNAPVKVLEKPLTLSHL